MALSRRKIVAVAAAAAVGGAAAYLIPRPLPELSRAEFMAEIRAGHVSAVVIDDRETITGVSSARGRFRTGFDRSEDSGLPAKLRALGVEVRFTHSTPGLI